MCELALEFQRRGVAVRLVGRVDLVAEIALERFVEGHRDALGTLPLEQLQHEAGEAVHGVDRMAGAVDQVERHRMPRPEHVQAGVDEVDRAGHGTQSVSSSRGSGRSRSGASPVGVPMWMKPSTRSVGARPSVAAMTGS